MRNILAYVVVIITVTVLTIAYALPARAQTNTPCFAFITCDGGSHCSCEGCGSCGAFCAGGDAVCNCGSCGGIQ